MKKLFVNKANCIISCLGLLIVSAVFIIWWQNDNEVYKAGFLAALSITIIFIIFALKFVRKWMQDWEQEPQADDTNLQEPKNMLGIFFIFLVIDIIDLLLAVYLRELLPQLDRQGIPHGFDIFWHIDTGKYLDIAEFFYNKELSKCWPMCLVFFPGYPIIVKIVNLFFDNYLLSGLVVSAAFYAMSACLLYKVLLLDFEEKTARNTLKYFAILPAAFFFAFPMSESVFVFYSLLSYYLMRKKRWMLSCIFGAYCAFTRSAGILIIAPIVFEMVRAHIHGDVFFRPRYYLYLLIVPLGLVAYLVINYYSAGNAFYFIEVEQTIWRQGLGLFFDTAAQITERCLSFWHYDDLRQYVPGVGIPNLICIFAYLFGATIVADKTRSDYLVWFLVCYVFSIGAKELLSGPRYLVATIPVYPMIAEFTKKKMADVFLTVCCALFFAVYIFEFSLCLGVY